jgi:GrpB-like predicted nucleotidyltransferase (UPF0157 family)
MTSLEAPIEIVPYDQSWPIRSHEEADAIRRMLAPWLVGTVEHIGSTAIPPLAGKPVIDIMAGVRTLEESRPAITVATELGYCYAPYQAEVEHWFCKPSPTFRLITFTSSRSERRSGFVRLLFATTCVRIRTWPVNTRR